MKKQERALTYEQTVLKRVRESGAGYEEWKPWYFELTKATGAYCLGGTGSIAVRWHDVRHWNSWPSQAVAAAQSNGSAASALLAAPSDNLLEGIHLINRLSKVPMSLRELCEFARIFCLNEAWRALIEMRAGQRDFPRYVECYDAAFAVGWTEDSLGFDPLQKEYEQAAVAASAILAIREIERARNGVEALHQGNYGVDRLQPLSRPFDDLLNTVVFALKSGLTEQRLGIKLEELTALEHDCILLQAILSGQAYVAGIDDHHERSTAFQHLCAAVLNGASALELLLTEPVLASIIPVSTLAVLRKAARQRR